MKKYSIIALLLCVFGIWNFASAKEIPNGARLYVERCAGCHGPDGQGGINVPPLAGMGAENVLKKINAYADGKADLHADPEMIANIKKLTPQERTYVAYYIGTLAQAWK